MTALADAFGIYHFESLTLGIQPLLDRLDPNDVAQMEKLCTVIMEIKKHPDFIAMTKGGGKNSIGLLNRRIEFVTNKMLESFPA